jgi:hypothetical protein
MEGQLLPSLHITILQTRNHLAMPTKTALLPHKQAIFRRFPFG